MGLNLHLGCELLGTEWTLRTQWLGSGTQGRVSLRSKGPGWGWWAWRCALGRGLGGASSRRLIELRVCWPTHCQSAAAGGHGTLRCGAGGLAVRAGAAAV